MMLAIALVCLPLIFFYLVQRHRITKANAGNNPPGPPPLPIIGNLHQLDASDLHRHLWLLSKQYGPLMSLRLGPFQALVVSSAKMADSFLKTYDRQIAGRPSLVGQRKYSYNGSDLVFSTDVDYWREIRKLCVIHLFSPKRVQSFRSIREDEVRRMIGKISKSASKRKVVNLNEAMTCLTSSIICRVAFGKRYEDEGIESSRFHALLKEAQVMMTMFYFSDHFPLLGWIDRLTGVLQRLHRNVRDLDAFYEEIINDHMHSPQSQHDNFISLCLGLMNDHSFSFDLTITNIKALLMDIFVAGTDTGAAALVWAMTALIKNPRVMKKVKEEIRNLYPGKHLIDEDDVQKLSYMKAVVKETMRVFPPAPLMVPREVTESCKIEGYDVKAKTVIYFNVWGIGRDAEAWEKAEEFYPERFQVEGRSVELKGQEYGLLAFGGGRRICPGLQMGMVEVELALANLLNAFDWDLPQGMKREDIDTDVIPGIAMHKKNALCLVPTTIMQQAQP